MIKKYMTKEVAKVVGEAGYRIGKDIVREGAKVVVGKTIGAVIGTAIVGGGIKEIKNIKLDTILGDITRKEKKELRKLRKQERITAKDIKKKAEDLKNKVEAKMEDIYDKYPVEDIDIEDIYDKVNEVDSIGVDVIVDESIRE